MIFIVRLYTKHVCCFIWLLINWIIVRIQLNDLCESFSWVCVGTGFAMWFIWLPIRHRWWSNSHFLIKRSPIHSSLHVGFIEEFTIYDHSQWGSKRSKLEFYIKGTPFDRCVSVFISSSTKTKIYKLITQNPSNRLLFSASSQTSLSTNHSNRRFLHSLSTNSLHKHTGESDCEFV